MNKMLQRKINVLTHLAKADGKFHAAERVFLETILKEQGFEGAYQEEHMAPDLEMLGETPDKGELLFWAFKLMRADGFLDPREIEYCKTLCVKLGYQPALVDVYMENEVISLQEFEKILTGFLL